MEVTRGVVANGVDPEVNGEVDMVEMLVAMEAGEVMVGVMIKDTEAVAMEDMVVTPPAAVAKPHEVCPGGVCVVASKCEVGVAAATVEDAVAPVEASLIRERGIKTERKKEKLQNMLFPHSESALFKFKTSKNNYQIPTIVKNRKKIIVSFFDTMIICVPTIPNPVCLLRYIS